MNSSLVGLAENAVEATKIARANLSPRQQELETLERYACGTQYEGRPDWFSNDVPLWERAPCIVYPMAAIAIRSNVDLVLGESRFPVITSNPGEDDAEAEGLDEEQSKQVDRALSELLERVRFRSVSRQALEHAQQAKSVAVIAGARQGRPFLELVRSRWCEPTFGPDDRLIRLEIRYPYLDWQKQADGHWKVFAKLYRRVIDERADTTYMPVEAPADGRDPPPGAWVPDRTKTVEHQLGFCPAHWYAHMRECSTVNDYDGQAVHENVLDEIRGLDFALSQRHRAALFCGDPQIWETGVEKGYNPVGATGREASVPSTYAGGGASDSNPRTGAYQAVGAQPARVKSPGVVWQYEDQNSKVGYLVLPPEALQALDEHAADLRNKIAESLSVVILDPQNAKFTSDISGKAIEQLRARQFDRCDQIRDDVAVNWVVPVVQLLLRVALKVGLPIPAVTNVRATLAKFVANDAAAPMLFVRWPTGYIKPDPTDEVAIVSMATSAVKGGIATRRMAVQKVAGIFGVSNVDQAVEALEKESKDNQERQRALMASAAKKPDEDPAPFDPKATEAA